LVDIFYPSAGAVFSKEGLFQHPLSISLKTLSAGVAREREVGEAVIIKARREAMPKANRGRAGRPVREATNIAANADAQLDGKEIDPGGSKTGSERESG
jgi:hypothetical protein